MMYMNIVVKISLSHSDKASKSFIITYICLSISVQYNLIDHVTLHSGEWSQQSTLHKSSFNDTIHGAFESKTA